MATQHERLGLAARNSSQDPVGHDASRCWLTKINSCMDISGWRSRTDHLYSHARQVSQERRDASLTEHSFDAKALSSPGIEAACEKGKTFLYLAYGSNLCEETFKIKRGIRPISQINVHVPSLRLTFDLPGIPYLEPCFANSSKRDPDAMENVGYHKDRWQKGLVGCVYEVTPSDYAHIIATEGGGVGYQDILVDCYPLLDGHTVPTKPTGQRFLAHTLFATPSKSNARPDPSYAQPSARYLNLITTGAAELSLPLEYQTYLNEIRSYTITTRRQRLGKVLFAVVWVPFLQLLFALNAKYQDKKGRSPLWLIRLSKLIFLGIWGSYDGIFKNTFGDGERTNGDSVPIEIRGDSNREQWKEAITTDRRYRDDEKIENMV